MKGSTLALGGKGGSLHSTQTTVYKLMAIHIQLMKGISLRVPRKQKARMEKDSNNESGQTFQRLPSHGRPNNNRQQREPREPFVGQTDEHPFRSGVSPGSS